MAKNVFFKAIHACPCLLHHFSHCLHLGGLKTGWTNGHPPTQMLDIWASFFEFGPPMSLCRQFGWVGGWGGKCGEFDKRWKKWTQFDPKFDKKLMEIERICFKTWKNGPKCGTFDPSIHPFLFEELPTVILHQFGCINYIHPMLPLPCPSLATPFFQSPAPSFIAATTTPMGIGNTRRRMDTLPHIHACLLAYLTKCILLHNLAEWLKL